MRHDDAAGLRETFTALKGHLRPQRLPLIAGILLLIASGGLGLAQPLAAREVLEALALDQSLTTPLLKLSALVVAAAFALGFGNFLLLAPPRRSCSAGG